MDDFGQIFKVQNTDGMVDKDPSKATAIGTLLQAGGMVSSASDNLVFPYSAEPGNQNPKYELIELVGGTQILFFASNYMPVSYTHLDVYKRQMQWLANSN